MGSAPLALAQVAPPFPNSGGTQLPLPVSHLSAQTQVMETFQYDSNPLLVSSGQKAAMSSITAPQLTINSDTPDSHLDSDTTFDINKYDLPGYSSNDLHSKLHATGIGTTWSSTVAASFDSDTTRTSEQTTSGRNVAGIGRTAYSLAPQIGYLPTQVDQILMSGAYSASSYSNTAQYTNFEVMSLTPSYAHSFDPNNIGTLTLPVSRYETTSGPQTTFDSVGLSGGWKRTISPTFNLSGDLGMQRSVSTFGASLHRPSTTNYDYIADASATWKTQQDIFVLTLTHASTPQSSGTESQTTAFNVNETHYMTPKFEVDLTAGYQFSDYPGSSAGGQYVQASYTTLNPHAAYHITDTFNFNFGYRYSRQVMETLGQSTLTTSPPAASNSILFSISYVPKPEALNW